MRLIVAVLATITMGCARDAASEQDPGPQAGAESGAAVQASLADSTLANLVARIQPAVERASGIRARAPLAVAQASAERLRAYLQGELDRQLTPEREAAVHAAYVRFGLIPDSLDLRALLEAILEEQVVGYYDPASDTLFVLNHVAAEQLETVLAHELVHALQDQYFQLDSLGHAVSDRNDAALAAQSAIEGHATYAMTEWQMGQMTGAPADLTRLPDLGEMFANVDLAAMGGGAAMAVLNAAPAVIREDLIFPYIGGLSFMQRLWRQAPERPLPFGAGLPSSTEQVLHIERYGTDAPTRVDWARPADGSWSTVYENGLGELELRVYLTEHGLDEATAESAAAGWDGDAFRLLRGGEGEVLIWLTVWDSHADATEFESAVEAALAQRYADAGGRTYDVTREDLEGRPVVRIVDRPDAVPARELEQLIRARLSESG